MFVRYMLGALSNAMCVSNAILLTCDNNFRVDVKHVPDMVFINMQALGKNTRIFPY